jgi:hypothetical protein
VLSSVIICVPPFFVDKLTSITVPNKIL